MPATKPPFEPEYLKAKKAYLDAFNDVLKKIGPEDEDPKDKKDNLPFRLSNGYFTEIDKPIKELDKTVGKPTHVAACKDYVKSHDAFVKDFMPVDKDGFLGMKTFKAKISAAILPIRQYAVLHSK